MLASGRCTWLKALVLREYGRPLVTEDRPAPQPVGDQVLVRVSAVGVCHTDVHIWEGRIPLVRPPIVLGHEISGEAPGLGQVVVYASWGCGACAACRAGEEQLCPHGADAGWVRDGGYADYVLVPSPRYLRPLKGVNPAVAAPLADAGITSYRAVRRSVPWLASSTRPMVVVIGVGALGQLAIQFLKLLADARIVAVDLLESKRDRALKLGAEQAVGPDEMPSEARVVLDFVGSDSSLSSAVRIVEKTGLVVHIGESGGRFPFGLGAVPNESRFTTSIWGSAADLDAVLGYAQKGSLDLPVEEVPLSRATEALNRVRYGQVEGRLVLVP